MFDVKRREIMQSINDLGSCRGNKTTLYNVSVLASCVLDLALQYETTQLVRGLGTLGYSSVSPTASDIRHASN
jgi:hypothetical protein